MIKEIPAQPKKRGHVILRSFICLVILSIITSLPIYFNTSFEVGIQAVTKLFVGYIWKEVLLVQLVTTLLGLQSKDFKEPKFLLFGHFLIQTVSLGFLG